MARSLRGRLGAGLAAVAAVSVAVSALIAFGLVRGYSEQAAQRDLERIAEATAIEARAGRLASQADLPVVRGILRVSGVRLAFIGPQGRIGGEGAQIVGDVDVRPLLEGREIRGVVHGYAYIGLPVDVPRVRGIVLSRALGQAGEIWKPVVARLGIAAAVAIAAAFGISALLARRLSEPLADLATGAARVAGGDLSHRVPVPPEQETARVATSFNAMAAALGEARRREREMLANVSHELKTPLTSIRGYVEALEEGAVRDAAGRAHALSVIHSETTRLELLVQDVLDLARLGARELRIDARPVDLAPTLRDAAGAHAAQAAAAGVRLDVEAPASMPACTDDARVRQVVSNLLDNAIRATPPGGVVRLRGAASAGGALIEVADTGPGIAADHLPHVFERSYLRAVAGGDVAPQAGGLARSGLGLAIVRELVEALGGRLAVHSTPGEGTIFRVSLGAA